MRILEIKLSDNGEMITVTKDSNNNRFTACLAKAIIDDKDLRKALINGTEFLLDAFTQDAQITTLNSILKELNIKLDD